MSNWAQIDFFETLVSGEPTPEQRSVDIVPTKYGPLCSRMDEAEKNDYGDFINKTYTFVGGNVKGGGMVEISVAVKRPCFYYAFGVNDGNGGSFQALCIDSEREHGIYDGITDVMRHTAKKLKEFCIGYNVKQSHIDKVLNDLRKAIIGEAR